MVQRAWDALAAGAWIQAVAALVFLALLWTLLRFALGLRYSKVVREQERAAQGGRVVAEIPSAAGEVGFFVEGTIGEAARPGVVLPPAGVADEFEGRERWDVVLYLRDATAATVPCGTLREGVSREVAARVFDAVRAGL
jgi:hypothetical protein